MSEPCHRVLSARRILTRSVHGDSGEDRWAFCPGTGGWALCDGASESWAAFRLGRRACGFAGALRSRKRRVAHARRNMNSLRNASVRRNTSGLCSGVPGWLSSRGPGRGSWSTALWARKSPSGRLFHAAAVGATCLFLLDGFSCLWSFPLRDPCDFGSAPALIGDQGPAPPFETRIIPAAPYRRPSLLLATESLAARLLREPPEHLPNLLRFLFRCAVKDFSCWVEQETVEGRMKEDDCTLLWLQ